MAVAESRASLFAPLAPHHHPESLRLIKVLVRPNESLEAALRRFKRQCNYGGVFRMAKANSWHEKRSDKRRRERRERLRTIQKATRKNDPKRKRGRKRSMRSPRMGRDSREARPSAA
ncbi:MAG TPA: 30S ribosomal protein S21 [Planctomycetota bacterium]|nr:30S ribosomal protein S21 [Planctomycetota bacterium]